MLLQRLLGFDLGTPMSLGSDFNLSSSTPPPFLTILTLCHNWDLSLGSRFGPLNPGALYVIL